MKSKAKRKIQAAFNTELDLSKKNRLAGKFQESWLHLERAHIIGQSSAFLHTYAHFVMLMLALRTFDIKETLGQIIRLVLAGPSSLFAFAPRGNSGRANVPLTKSMALPKDLLWIGEIDQEK